MKFSPARLKEAMELRDIRASALSDATGLSRARISQYTNGKYTPGGEALCRLARALAVSEAWLMGQDVPPELPSAQEAAPEPPCPPNVTPLHLRRYPVLGRIACGEPILAVEDGDGSYVTATENGADFCLTAKGDSMIGARIYDGDEVFIRQADMVNNGEIAAVVVNDEATLKRVYYYPEENRLVLTPENPAYAPLVFIGEELNGIRILGKAVAVQSRLQ